MNYYKTELTDTWDIQTITSRCMIDGMSYVSSVELIDNIDYILISESEFNKNIPITEESLLIEQNNKTVTLEELKEIQLMQQNAQVEIFEEQDKNLSLLMLGVTELFEMLVQ